MQQQLSVKIWFLEASGTGTLALLIILVLSLALFGLVYSKKR